ncbi:UNVERIFIED_CONTAM: hypothetical protein HDU68_009205 [Siphonaria sp. JEL0065]|nr:hypothetical protein HDU68_009205 [Siphonaria sp. JEL0065]
MQVYLLSDATLWQLEEWGTSEPTNPPIRVSSFPTDVFTDLAAAGIINEPTRNEEQVQWVALRNWKYSCRFRLDSFNHARTYVLALDGLDTVATVILNGIFLETSDNMFVPLRINLDLSILREDNVLEIKFASATLRAKQLEETHGKSMCSNGDPSRVYLRKAQYHWGWDWGPTFVTCGVWRDVHLECFEARIDHVYAQVNVHESLKFASIKVLMDVQVSRASLIDPASMSCIVSIQTPSGTTLVIKSFRGFKSDNDLGNTSAILNIQKTIAEIKIGNPQLWFPIGAGQQPLYNITCTLLHPTRPTPLHTHSHKFGIRRLELVEQHLPAPNTQQTSFYFSINNRPVLAAGSNWIPSSTSLSHLSNPRTYKKWLTLLIQGNQNMIRVWGGGVYESDAFYELCDELGIMVWQDFMFACAAYPAYDAFVKSIREEATVVVKRLRRFASLVIFTGNNEDYAFAEENPQLGYDPKCDDETQWKSSKFPARLLYERVLPEIISTHSPSIPYKPGSPWTSHGRPSGSLDAGDSHQWNVWHGTQEPYQNYGKLCGRFISEFGMQGFPVLETSRSFFEDGTLDEEMDAASKVLDSRNKATGFSKRLGGYLFENLRFGGTRLDEFTYATQLVQSEALATAYSLWRREWGTPGNHRTGGALVWQLNDCWPCVSWSIVDHNVRPKPSYFGIKRVIAPVTVGLSKKGDGKCEVWAVNTTEEQVEGILELKWFGYRDGDVKGRERWDVIVPKNCSVELGVVEIGSCVEDLIVGAQILSGDGTVLCTRSDWPQPLKYLPKLVPNRGVKVDVENHGDGCATLRVFVERPVKGLNLTIQGCKEGDEEVKVSDNFVDVLPGDVVVIQVEGWREGMSVGWLYYNM